MELKDKIIQAAFDLFAEKGFEKATVSEIINLAGSSKGGFYHHFKSKDEILEAITSRYIDELKTDYEKLLQHQQRSTIELWNHIFAQLIEYKLGKIPEWPKMRKIFSFNGNHIILKNFASQFEVMTTELYTQLILQGVREGVFHVKHPNMLAGLWSREMIRVVSICRKLIFSTDVEAYEEFEMLLAFNEDLINRELGVSSNMIQIKEVALQYVQQSRKRLEHKEEFDD
ncbi:TetR/AcrR family transcriptional regulator [Bacillus sp. SM2101]|uniref:TetR/AcrR family transcriptional regulator n=1 Tax=Bacillus sp. SM2101 TaxID=2805366 RepID=UPI001BDF3F64|nr:TetR/AcrR family transcriptional regulator [Bacillus sp. SM2101]